MRQRSRVLASSRHHIQNRTTVAAPVAGISNAISTGTDAGETAAAIRSATVVKARLTAKPERLRAKERARLVWAVDAMVLR